MCDFILNKLGINYIHVSVYVLTKKLPLKVCRRVCIYCKDVPCGTRMNQYLPFGLYTTLQVAIRNVYNIKFNIYTYNYNILILRIIIIIMSQFN